MSIYGHMIYGPTVFTRLQDARKSKTDSTLEGPIFGIFFSPKSKTHARARLRRTFNSIIPFEFKQKCLTECLVFSEPLGKSIQKLITKMYTKSFIEMNT